jgi:hypothetical protein
MYLLMVLLWLLWGRKPNLHVLLELVQCDPKLHNLSLPLGYLLIIFA